MIECIVFDFDGTLVLSNDIKLQTFYEITRSYDPSGTIVTQILEKNPNKDRYGIFHALAQELFNKNLIAPSKRPDIIAPQWVEAYTFRCEQAIEACEEVSGTTETLQWISERHIPIFINSRTPATTLKQLVTLRTLNSYVSEIYGAPATKSENLRHIQNKTQAKPNEILFVGDSEDDRIAAQEVGCHFVGVVVGEKSRFSHPCPELQVTNLYQLQEIVTTLQEKDSLRVNNY